MTDRFTAHEYGTKILIKENGEYIWSNSVHKRLNELYNENEELKSEKQAIKKIIQELNEKTYDYFFDTAMLNEELQKIAEIIGVEWK